MVATSDQGWPSSSDGWPNPITNEFRNDGASPRARSGPAGPASDEPDEAQAEEAGGGDDYWSAPGLEQDAAPPDPAHAHDPAERAEPTPAPLAFPEPDPDPLDPGPLAPDAAAPAPRRSRRTGLVHWLYERWLYQDWSVPGWLREWRTPRRSWLPPLAFIAACLVLFFFYLGQARTILASSEGAGQALQAWGMLHGNLLLHGWTLSDVSFYTTELPEYMLVEKVFGLNSDTVPIAAALSWTLIVALGALVARGQARGREGLARMLIAAGILLAPPLSTTYLLLSAPDHTGTHVALLLIWLAADRPRPRWWIPVAVTVLLIWAQIADTLVLYEGAIPLALACLLQAYRRRDGWRVPPYYLALVAGAGISAVVARVTLKLIYAVGGFKVKVPIAQFSTPGRVTSHFWPSISAILQVFGADFFGKTVSPGLFSIAVHGIGLVLVVVALVIAVRGLYATGDLIAQVLTLGFVIVVVAYVLGTKADINEIVGLLPLGAVLAGRVLGDRILRTGLVPALCLALVLYTGLFVYDGTRPAFHRSAQQDVVGFLEAHHLRYGLSGFWNASAVTMDSGGKVTVRPGRVFRDRFVTTISESDRSWYRPRIHDANFVIASQFRHCTGTCVSAGELIKTFGPPAKAYISLHYDVLVWNKNLLAHLRILFWCRGWPWDTFRAPAAGPCPVSSGPGSAPSGVSGQS